MRGRPLPSAAGATRPKIRTQWLDEPALAVPEPVRAGICDDPGGLPQAAARLPALR